MNNQSVNQKLINLCSISSVNPEILIKRINILDEIKTLFKESENEIDVNFKNDKNNTPLICACAIEEIDLVELLLKHSADVNLGNSEGDTPLIISCWRGNKAMVSLLLKYGADVNIKNEFKDTAIMKAIRYKYEEIVSILFNNNPGSESQKEALVSTLFWAIKTQRLKTIRQILFEYKIDINYYCRKYPSTPLMVACYYGKKEIVSFLLDNGADINMCTNTTALSSAAYNGSYDICSLLLKRGADVNIQISPNRTPLTDAISIGNESIIQLFLDNGAIFPIETYKNRYYILHKTMIKTVSPRKTNDTLGKHKRRLQKIGILIPVEYPVSGNSCIQFSLYINWKNNLFLENLVKNQIRSI